MARYKFFLLQKKSLALTNQRERGGCGLCIAYIFLFLLSYKIEAFMIRKIFFLLCLITAPVAAQEQDLLRLFSHFKKAAAFDYNFPRERVYLHLDNNGYFEGDTIYFKAYVMRASHLLPTDLSRVLYAELLDADGRLYERKLLQIDSLGQAHGDFSLELPVRSGFYELRAYTREMLNWGAETCFSRVVPVFAKQKRHKDDLQPELLSADFLTIDRPEKEEHLSPGHPRQFLLDNNKHFLLDFYPEGGNRVGGTTQRVAFRLTNGYGQPLSDSLYIYNKEGEQVGLAETTHEGMGRFLLPADLDEGYALVASDPKALRFALPSPVEGEAYALAAYPHPEGVRVVVTQGTEAGSATSSSLLGLAVSCREQMCYFDTLSASQNGLELLLPTEKLRGGVNRIELFDTEGHSLARRLVWKEPQQKGLSLRVLQNDSLYMPFNPVALELYLQDADGKPVSTTMSLSVRDDGGDLIATRAESYSSLLLSSEVKGYIHHPEFYFSGNSPLRFDALDLLLMVQGWTANDFSRMCGAEPFNPPFPIEDRLTLNGTIFDFDKPDKPLKNVLLELKMYSPNGGSMNGSTKSDSLGRFVFQSNSNYHGNWIAQITTKNNKGRRIWTSVAFDRWFTPQPRTYDFREMMLEAPRRTAAVGEVGRSAATELFTWKDTIQNKTSYFLGEAVVKGKKYKGFTGNRYSYNGGEDRLKRHADHFYNIEMEVERIKDKGEAVGVVWDLLAQLNPHFYCEPDHNSIDSYNLFYRNRNIGGGGNIFASEVKSAAIIEAENRFRGNINSVAINEQTGDAKVGINYNESATSLTDANAIDTQTSNDAEARQAVEAHENENSLPYQQVYAKDPLGGAVMIYERPNFYRYKMQRGRDKRIVYGFSVPKKFFSPNYRNTNVPTDSDHRRTLFWNPSVRTDGQGKASAVFFSNSRYGQKLRFSARALTKDGRFLFFEK